MKLGFTGTSNMPDHSWDKIDYAIPSLDYEPELVVTGGCVGVDAMVGIWFYQYSPDIPQLVLLPNNLKKVNPWWEKFNSRNITVKRNCGTYMERNDAIVAESDELMAFPLERDEVLRSGTWATIRRGRKAGIPVHIFPLT